MAAKASCQELSGVLGLPLRYSTGYVTMDSSSGRGSGAPPEIALTLMPGGNDLMNQRSPACGFSIASFICTQRSVLKTVLPMPTLAVGAIEIGPLPSV